MRPQRLTIDVNVARDFLDAARPGHGDAVELFRLARERVVDLAAAPQGYAIDVHGALSEQLNTLFEDEKVVWTPQLAYASELTYPSDDLYPGAYVEDLAGSWAEVVTTWRSHEGKVPQPQDLWHVETHINAGRDVFLTSDKPLLAMCKRLRIEHGVVITAMSITDYLNRRAADVEPAAAQTGPATP